MSHKSPFPVLKILFGVLLLLNGFALIVFLGLHQRFPTALEWVWGTISYTVFFGLGRALFMIVFGLFFIWIGRQYFRGVKGQKPKR